METYKISHENLQGIPDYGNYHGNPDYFQEILVFGVLLPKFHLG